jgi:hypothetical protein
MFKLRSSSRPLSITIISWVFIAMGCITFAAGLLLLIGEEGVQGSAIVQSYLESGLALLTRFLSIICGVFILYGYNWARWLLVVWMAFHVIISFNSTIELIVHSLLFSLVIFFLFRPRASAYFLSKETGI